MYTTEQIDEYYYAYEEMSYIFLYKKELQEFHDYVINFQKFINLDKSIYNIDYYIFISCIENNIKWLLRYRPCYKFSNLINRNYTNDI